MALIFKALYVGGHKLQQKSKSVKVMLFEDKLTVSELNLEIPYKSISNVENLNKKKISSMKIDVLSPRGGTWKKKSTYTVIEYIDELGKSQSIVIDFNQKILVAQSIIYTKKIQSQNN